MFGPIRVARSSVDGVKKLKRLFNVDTPPAFEVSNEDSTKHFFAQRHALALASKSKTLGVS